MSPTSRNVSLSPKLRKNAEEPKRCRRPAYKSPTILDPMRTFSLMFAAIALVMLAMFLIYVIRGPVDPLIAGGLFVSFLACLTPALFLLKPFEPPEELKRRRDARKERAEGRRSNGGPRRGSGS